MGGSGFRVSGLGFRVQVSGLTHLFRLLSVMTHYQPVWGFAVAFFLWTLSIPLCTVFAFYIANLTLCIYTASHAHFFHLGICTCMYACIHV